MKGQLLEPTAAGFVWPNPKGHPLPSADFFKKKLKQQLILVNSSCNKVAVDILPRIRAGSHEQEQPYRNRMGTWIQRLGVSSSPKSKAFQYPILSWVMHNN